MKIKSIIAEKRAQTIAPGASIHDLINALNTYKVGALVVSQDGTKIDGIASERDIIRGMPERLDELTKMHVRDIMTAEVYTCTVETTVAELMALMTQRRIRHVPVVNSDGSLLSIISIGDVVRNHISELDFERKVLQEYVDTSR